jgi:hypothetical protein
VHEARLHERPATAAIGAAFGYIKVFHRKDPMQCALSASAP